MFARRTFDSKSPLARDHEINPPSESRHVQGDCRDAGKNCFECHGVRLQGGRHWRWRAGHCEPSLRSTRAPAWNRREVITRRCRRFVSSSAAGRENWSPRAAGASSQSLSQTPASCWYGSSGAVVGTLSERKSSRMGVSAPKGEGYPSGWLQSC